MFFAAGFLMENRPFSRKNKATRTPALKEKHNKNREPKSFIQSNLESKIDHNLAMIILIFLLLFLSPPSSSNFHYVNTIWHRAQC